MLTCFLIPALFVTSTMTSSDPAWPIVLTNQTKSPGYENLVKLTWQYRSITNLDRSVFI